MGVTFFTSPSRIVQNGNLDYCVRNVVYECKDFRVIVIDKAGIFRWSYSGNDERGFHPFGICCDMYCNVIICDYLDKLHLLDKDGNFIRLLLTADDGIRVPFGIQSYTDGTFWMGQFGRNRAHCEIFGIVNSRFRCKLYKLFLCNFYVAVL